MTYTHLTIEELVFIEAYYKNSTPVLQIAKKMKRSRQTITNVVAFLKAGRTAHEYYKQYQLNKKRCGRKKTELTKERQELVQEKLDASWSLDVIKGYYKKEIPCCSRTLYRLADSGLFPVKSLPWKGKRRPNNHQEKRGKLSFKRNLRERAKLFPSYQSEKGHLEGDTIVGAEHKSCVITLVECVSKVIFTLKTTGRKAKDIEESLDAWLSTFPKHRFKSITFDCGKEFSNWQAISNKHDIDIFFADPGCPGQRGLNEHSNGLLRSDGLPKKMDFTDVSQEFLDSVANKRNHIPRKSLNYRTPWEVFLGMNDCLA